MGPSGHASDRRPTLGALLDAAGAARASLPGAGVRSRRDVPGQPGALRRLRRRAVYRAGRNPLAIPDRRGGPLLPCRTPTQVFVGSGDGRLYAVDRRSGRLIWRVDAGGSVDASPAVADGLVTAATLGGRIFAVEQHTGRVRWSRRTGPALPLNTTPAGGWDLFASSPVVTGRTVVIGSPDGGIYALDLATGAQRWRAMTGGRVRATPAIHDSLVVVGSWDGRVYALDLATGTQRWVHRTVGDTLDSKTFGFDRRAIQSSAAVAGGMVFVGSRDGALYGLDAA